MKLISGHPYFVGVQFHPEYLSHPLQPSPPFFGLICAASNQLESYFRGSKESSSVNVLKAAENIVRSWTICPDLNFTHEHHTIRQWRIIGAVELQFLTLHV